MQRHHPLPVYRDRLSAWEQSAADPDSPEAVASVERARAEQRKDRAALLELLFDSPNFHKLFVEFFTEDPHILSLLSARVAARGMVQRHRAEQEQ